MKFLWKSVVGQMGGKRGLQVSTRGLHETCQLATSVGSPAICQRAWLAFRQSRALLALEVADSVYRIEKAKCSVLLVRGTCFLPRDAEVEAPGRLSLLSWHVS
jgi:hypothetical protein